LAKLRAVADEQAGRLGHPLDDERRRHDRPAPAPPRLIVQVILRHADVLDGDNLLARRQREHAVDPHPSHGNASRKAQREIQEEASFRSTKFTSASTVKISATLPTLGSCSSREKSACGRRSCKAARPLGVTLPFCTYSGS